MLVVANQTLVGDALLDKIRERAVQGPASFLIVCPQSEPTAAEHPQAERGEALDLRPLCCGRWQLRRRSGRGGERAQQVADADRLRDRRREPEAALRGRALGAARRLHQHDRDSPEPFVVTHLLRDRQPVHLRHRCVQQHERHG